MTIHAKQHFAIIEHEEVHYEGQSFTPASWANHIAGHSRNAWRDIYVKRPTDSEWVFANTLRQNEVAMDQITTFFMPPYAAREQVGMQDGIQ